MKNSWIQTFRRLAAATVVAGTTMYYSAMCYANAFDVATNPPYAPTWDAGDNGGTGFGPWSFNGTDPTPAGTYQGMSSSSPLGTSWTLLTHSTSSGLANAGRSITGGLLPGQTFSTIIENPSTTPQTNIAVTADWICCLPAAPTTMFLVTTRLHSGHRYSTTSTRSALEDQ